MKNSMNHPTMIDAKQNPNQGNGRTFMETINPLTLPGRAWRRFFYRVYRPLFCQQNYIFRHEGPFPAETRTDCAFRRYDAIENIPQETIDDMQTNGVPGRLKMDRAELQEHASLWIAMIDGHAACTVFTREGKHFTNWFLPIQAEDVIVFRLWTHPDYRGRGLAPSLMRHAMHEIMQPGGHAYIDCRTYNKPSIRCIEKSGFKCVAKKRTIKRDWALHDQR